MKLLACIRVIRKADQGGALVEFSLVFPFMVALAVGAADFARAYYVGIELVNIAHTGAAYGSYIVTISPNSSSAISTAASQVTPSVPGVVFNMPTATVVQECSDGTNASASATLPPTAICTLPAIIVYKIQVTASATYTTIMPWPGIPSSFILTRTATMRGCDGTGQC
jgi:Flp pilus assembly protein TadG